MQTVLQCGHYGRNAVIELLLLVGCIYILYKLATSSLKKEKNNIAGPLSQQVQEDNYYSRRDEYWYEYLSEFRAIVGTEAEKNLLDRIIARGPSHKVPANQVGIKPLETSTATANAYAKSPSITQLVADVPVTVAAKTPIDNALLLLYFGAFLFVASVGLFVAFGDVNGFARTLLVAAVMAVMYFGGLVLHDRVSRMKPAGITFVAIGMAIAPLVGMAAYNYMFAQTHGPVIWFGTSILTAAMYANALRKLRNPFIGYLFIFSFLSLFQSAISMFDAPLYYYIWGMIIAGMMLRFVSLISHIWPEMREPSAASAKLLVPVTLAVSLYAIYSQGTWQLAFSLLLGALFYGIEAFSTNGRNRQYYLLAAHVLMIGTVATGAFSLNRHVYDIVVALLAVSVLHALVLLIYLKNDTYIKDVGTLALASILLAGVLSINDTKLLLLSIISALLLGIIITTQQRRLDAYQYTALVLVILPLILGQVIISPRWYAATQSIACLVVVALLAGSRLWMIRKKEFQSWILPSDFILYISIIVAIAAAFFGSPWVVLSSCTVIALVFIIIGRTAKDPSWSSQAGFVMTIPVLKVVTNISQPELGNSMIIALLSNILIALRYRLEANRWLGATLWFLLPLGIGQGNYVYNFSVATYAWAYIVVMLGFIVARLIGRGALFPSYKVPIISYAKNASLAYQTGYMLAAIAAILLSLVANNSRLHTTAILLIVLTATVYISLKVERRYDWLALVPVLLQLALLSAIRPTLNNDLMDIFLLSSIAVSVIIYILTASSTQEDSKQLRMLRQSALITSYLPAAIILGYGRTVTLMPITLAVAGILTLYENRRSGQSNREMSGLVIVGAILWLMAHMGISNIQVYTHTLALVFAGYAYWRNVRGEKTLSDQYLTAMFGMATVPLVLQALAGTSGGLYGWWLLLEQIGFMLIGMAIGKRFLIIWGLYVSVAAVLYQLRNLGWAALTVLAVFIISLAVYHLGKQPASKNKTDQ